MGTDTIVFHSPDTPPFRLHGFHWRKPGGEFRRLPLRSVKLPLPDGVDGLAWHAAGGQLAFRSDTSQVVIRARLARPHRIVRAALTGLLGFDCYVGEPGRQLFCGVTTFGMDDLEYTSPVFKQHSRLMREFTIFFPLYAQVEQLEIGLDRDARIEPPTPWCDAQPLVAYGTSILQGACATRPGMCYTNQLSRKLNRPVLNFGFAGNARGEAVMARVLATIPNPALFLLDYDPNAGETGIRDTLYEFIHLLRKSHPAVPILTVSKIPYPEDLLLQLEGNDNPPVRRLEQLHREIVDRIRAEGDLNTYFHSGAKLLGADYAECSIDGCHITDLGFVRMSNALSPVIAGLLH